jgi:hypothetical protein
MEQPSTCGEGLAENSVLPAKLSELAAAIADTLEAHLQALDVDDENARREHDAYVGLVREHRRAAALLQKTSEDMEGCRTLPMAPHDPEKLVSSDARAAFARFVRAEEDFAALLEQTLERDRAMLAQMRGAGD